MSTINHEYEVTVFQNRHEEVEVIISNSWGDEVARLWGDWNDQPTTVEEGDYAISLWADDGLESGGFRTEYSIKKFIEVNHDEAENEEGSLYWELNTGTADWYRHPVWSWESCLAAQDGLMVLQPTGRHWAANLESIFKKVESEYREQAEDELPRLA